MSSGNGRGVVFPGGASGGVLSTRACTWRCGGQGSRRAARVPVDVPHHAESLRLSAAMAAEKALTDALPYLAGDPSRPLGWLKPVGLQDGSANTMGR